ncbi:MAG: carboxylesterase family protein [Bacteroidota bacterium]
MKKGILIFSLLFLSFAAYSQSRYVDSLFAEVQTTTYTYAIKDSQELKLDVYLPLGDTMTKRACMVWMHGGGFAGGRRDNGAEVKLMQQMAKRGYVAISISYRLTRKGKSFSCNASRAEKMETFRLASKDLWDAVYFAYEKYIDFGIDPKLFIIGGSSAGAEGVLNAVYMKDWLYEGPSKYDSIQPAMVFSLAGAMIDQRYINSNNAVPAAFFHGTKDNLVPYATAPHHYCEESDIGYIWLDGSKSITQKLKAMGSSYLLYTFEEARHEIANIPFDRMQIVYQFFHDVMFEGMLIQSEVIVKKP